MAFAGTALAASGYDAYSAYKAGGLSAAGKSIARDAAISAAFGGAGKLVSKGYSAFKGVGAVEKVVDTDKGLLGNSMYKDALTTFKNSDLTNAGRALSKHPEIIGSTKQNLRNTLSTDVQLNSAASGILKNIMRNGEKSFMEHPRYGNITTHQLANGIGVRYYTESNKFIGFISKR